MKHLILKKLEQNSTDNDQMENKVMAKYCSETG